MTSTLDAIKNRHGSISETKIKTLSPGLQKLLREDVPALIEIAETVCRYIDFVKSPAPVERVYVFLDAMSSWAFTLKQKKDAPRQVLATKFRVLSD